MQETSEIFVCVDVEATGKLPWKHSMISLGAVAFRIIGGAYGEIASFWQNMYERDGSLRDPDTMRWWEKYPQAWEACRKDLRHPGAVMRAFVDWNRALPGASSFVAYPASFDFCYLMYYLDSYGCEQIFGHDALCIKSFALGALRGKSWCHFGKNLIPEKYHSTIPHDHTPLNDARNQAQLFTNLYRANVLQ